MTKKRDRQFPPDMCTRDTLAHRLDCSVDRIDKLVEQKLLPLPLMVGPLKRWGIFGSPRLMMNDKPSVKIPMMTSYTVVGKTHCFPISAEFFGV